LTRGEFLRLFLAKVWPEEDNMDTTTILIIIIVLIIIGGGGWYGRGRWF
jgi:hypothetical protein